MPNPLHRNPYKTFREMLRLARLDRGVTQEELAIHLGRPQSYVYKYERGERRLDFTEFVDVARALELDLKRFLDDYLACISLDTP